MRSVKDLPRHLVDFFSAEILALYANQSNKYRVQTDYFSGEIETCGNYYEECAEKDQRNTLSVKFGFRTRTDGELALAVWMPDLKRTSSDEVLKWQGFHVSQKSLSVGSDPRFEMWVQRYIDGNWDVENGVVATTRERINELNALTICTVGEPLFENEELTGLCFPTAQNNHRYHDAHSEVYKELIDGLRKDALVALGAKLGISLKNPANSKTVSLLKELLPTELHADVLSAFEVISTNRRLADHQKRPAAERMEAFETFNSDLTNLEQALRTIRDSFAARLKVSVESCVKRRNAMSVHPSFDPEEKVEAHYSICDIAKIDGKKISRVEYGWRKQDPRIHNSELIVIHFDDGSSMAIHTGSNIVNLCDNFEKLKPADLNISFALNYVPPVEKIP